MAKIYPNDNCPCKSGKKYKHCCGKKQQADKIDIESIPRSNLKLEDFVKERLSEDIAFIADALQLILGSEGYAYCAANEKMLGEEFNKDRFESFVQRDGMNIYYTTQDMKTKKSFQQFRSYGGEIPKEQMGIMELVRDEHICIKARQVELFHAYLMDNLTKRFDKYFYVPSDEVKDIQDFGCFAHRGFDFAIAITLYLELQLGVHVYFNLLNAYKYPDKDINACRNYYGIPDSVELNTGIFMLLADYANVIESVATRYSAEKEVAVYELVGAYKPDEIEDRKKVIKPGFYKSLFYKYDYISYLRYMVSATCFNLDLMYLQANNAFPQCDFIKYMYSLESIVELFEEKIVEREIEHIKFKDTDIDILKEFGVVNVDSTEDGKHIQTRMDIYHTTVFWMMDELNGAVNHMKPNGFHYEDFADINEDDYTVKNGKRNVNPARKSTRVHGIRKLRMELYNLLNGKFFTLQVGEEPGSKEGYHTIGKYTMLPWISSGEEKTYHIRPFDKEGRPAEDLYAFEIGKRQEFLTLEYRLTGIPVNCVEEYLNPQVFYNWKEKNELLVEISKQNDELKNVNDKLKRHIQLNQELVRNLSHSSANYLNAEKLAQTGIELNKADVGNPGPEQLHLDGLSLILQSEQEMYLSRQLNSLVWRCSADVESLSMQIRSGLSQDDGLDVMAPIEFALKTVIARVLFREQDRRSEFICSKMNKTDEELTNMKSSFMLDILAQNNSENGKVFEWWKQNIGGFTISESAAWSKLKLIKDKAFYDLITEIVTEQIMNALSHGDFGKGITVELGQAEEFKGRPKWVYISCTNQKGNAYTGGRGVGISTLNETMLLLNNNKRGIDITTEDEVFESKVWLVSSYLRVIKN